MIFRRFAKYNQSLLTQTRNSFTVGKIEPVYYDYSNTTKTTSPTSIADRWTSRLKPDTPLSMISIPGTHDSGTYFIHDAFQLP